MTSKQAYQVAYRLYRSLGRFERSETPQQIATWIKMVHALQPRAAANAHTSFSMRSLFSEFLERK